MTTSPLDHLFLSGLSKNPPDKITVSDPTLDLFSFDDFFNQPTSDLFSSEYTFDDFLSEETPILQSHPSIDSAVQISLPNSSAHHVTQHTSSDLLLSATLSPRLAKAYKPIAPAGITRPTPVNSKLSSKVANKRIRNTESARRSRERKALRLAELEKLLEESERTRITLASELAMLQSQKKRSWSN
ncbi:hypothetical protein HDV06_005642 [Boothiomyces sp. JEL0866]|nr:hypothetical protein HDV06_005642 [Boothiomyces sp. JEL0866]